MIESMALTVVGIVGALLGAALGVFATLKATENTNRANRLLEEARWAHQKQDEKTRALRDALEAAQDRLNLIWAAYEKVRKITHGELLEWPDLEAEIREHPLRPSHLEFLPEEIHFALYPIVGRFESMKFDKCLLDQMRESRRVLRQSLDGESGEDSKLTAAKIEIYTQEISAKQEGLNSSLSELEKLIGQYRDKLNQAHQATFKLGGKLDQAQ